MSGAVAALMLAGKALFTPVTRTYLSGSGTETIPTNANQVEIRCGGGGGGGGGTSSNNFGDGGGGGGGAGYCTRTIALTAAAWGKTLNYTAGINGSGGGTGGASLVSNNTFATSVAMTGNGGGAGGGGSFGAPGSAGAGGTATGGTTNLNGTDGGDGSIGGGAGFCYQPDGRGGGGTGREGIIGAGFPGIAGRVDFIYT